MKYHITVPNIQKGAAKAFHIYGIAFVGVQMNEIPPPDRCDGSTKSYEVELTEKQLEELSWGFFGTYPKATRFDVLNVDTMSQVHFPRSTKARVTGDDR